MEFQLAIIGGGPAGYTAAEYASKKGLSVVLFEKNTLGGVCLNEGCIPTKTLLYSSKLFHIASDSKKYGITTENATYNYKKFVMRKNKVVKKLVAGVRTRLEGANVTRIEGEAQIHEVAENQVIVSCNSELYTCDNVLLCTGSETFVPPIPGTKTAEFWTSREALESKELPESITIIGGGVIGMEFAGIYSTLGKKVDIVEMADEILPPIDAEIAAMLREQYTKNGVNFHLKAKVTKVETGLVTYMNEAGETLTIENEQILMCVGRHAAMTALGTVEFEKTRGGLQVNEHMQTSQAHIYAAGDLTGFSMLAHTAEREGLVAVNHIIGLEDKMTYYAIPGVVYTNPEIAGVGKMADLKEDEREHFRVVKLPMSYAGRFVAENEGVNGLCKLVVDENDIVVGCHIIGNPAGEIITIATMGIQEHFTLEQFKRIVFPHPTVSEIIKEVVFEA